ncbi:disks large-associated protein 4 [Nilaparvata lugens]|uniref:disks large-associated protein 4 n=1 Tax=Nilaparvata lugens TaxID=108931 RepID=UPI00193DFD15|nr:disks large-associated protein 4 [Nilaparvata lugens]
MERKDIYKFNPKIQDYKDVRRGDLVERRKSKRKECLDQRRNCIDECNKEQDVQCTISKGKENRRDLLKKWKEEQKRENQKNVKKPFVVGIVRHNAGSPMFKPVAPLKELRKPIKVQVTRPQATTSRVTATSNTTGVYCFGRQNPAQHKFKVANSVKKLTVPIAPSFMDPSKRGKLALKSKAETSAVLASKQNANSTYKKTVKGNPAPAEKRVTRAMTAAKGAVRKSPIKKVVTKNVNESSLKAKPSKKVAFEGNEQTDEVRTPEVETVIKNVVPTPAVTRKSDKTAYSSKTRRSRRHRVAFEVDHSDENITPEANRIAQHFVPTPAPRIKQLQIDSDEDENEAEEEAHIAMETDTNASAENTSTTARGAQEFYDRLQRETDALLQCCDRWSTPAFKQSVPQEVSDEIDSTVGQARLLVGDKFQQFKRLIHRFEEGSQPPVTSEDLNGFWDMIYIQVDKMNERFDHLADLKERNWTKKTVEIAAKKKVAAKPKATRPVVKSRFQEFMAKKKLEISKKSCDSQNETLEEGTQSKTDTPVGTPLQDKMMRLALDTSRSERRRSSLASASRVLRTSLIAKTLASPSTGNTPKVNLQRL